MNSAGKLIESNQTVAMKFAPTSTEVIEKEYAIYSYLDAVDNPAVEKYGIPAVYYYGKWEGISMISITLMDEKSKQMIEGAIERRMDGYNIFTTLSEVDILIMCREYVSR